MKKVKKQFIAGAKCPQCHQSDTVVLFVEDDIRYFECIECHYREQDTSDNKGSSDIAIFNIKD